MEYVGSQYPQDSWALPSEPGSNAVDDSSSDDIASSAAFVMHEVGGIVHCKGVRSCDV